MTFYYFVPSGDQDADAMYRSASCDWERNDYVVLDDDTAGGTAACPECRQPSIRLARD